MRNVFLKPFVWAFAMLAAFALMAGTAFAEVSVSGYVSGGWGPYSTEEVDGTGEIQEFTQLDAFHRSELNFSGGTDELSVKMRVRYQGNDEGTKNLAAARAAIAWMPMPALSIEITGEGYGVSSLGDNSAVTPYAGGLVADDQAVFGDDNLSQIALDYNAGAVTVGLAVTDNCLAQCGAEGAPAGFTLREENTFVVHAHGGAGAISYNLGYLDSGATAYNSTTGDTETVEGSGLQFGLKFSGGNFSVGLDIQQETATAVSSAADDQETTAMSVGVTAAGAYLGYWTSTTEAPGGNSTLDDEEMSSLVVGYSIPVGMGVVGPEYRQATDSSGADDLTDSHILLGFRSGF